MGNPLSVARCEDAVSVALCTKEHAKVDCNSSAYGQEPDLGFVPELAAGASETLNSQKKRPNPGQYDQKDMDAKKCLAVDAFEGMRFDTNIQLSLGQFVVGHGFTMGPQQPPPPGSPRGTPPDPAATYHFTSTYIKDDVRFSVADSAVLVTNLYYCRCNFSAGWELMACSMLGCTIN